jgi:cobalt-zinc-cadmium efflux system outer membrane protein
MRAAVPIQRFSVAAIAALIAGCASWENERSQSPVAAPFGEVEWKSSEQGAPDSPVVPATATVPELPAPKEEPKKPPVREPFQLPVELPGANAPPIKLPPLKGLSPEEREKKVRAAYPELPRLADEPTPEMPETGKPLNLGDLQEMALSRNPAIGRAAADADAAQGLMVQAGLYPNPSVGYQADQIEPGNKPSNNAGQQGAFIHQLIKTAGKLSLSQAVAGMDFANAQVALRRARIDVVTQVRSAYFHVIVAQETLRISRALAELADEVYRLQLRLVASGDTAGYEPLQLYAQALQARNLHVQALNRYQAAWKQLAASLGTPDLSPQRLAGGVDAPIPDFDSELARRRIRETHTDVLTAQNTILREQLHVRLQRVTPVPDVTTGTVIQHDNSTGNNQVSVLVGITLPIFDRNQGNIRAAHAQLARANDDLRVRQNELLARLAEAFGRYRSGRTIAAHYRESILPNLTRAYRAIYRRYQQEPEKIGFNDIVVAQQNLAQALSAYLSAAGEQWTAVVDVANLLQLDDIYQPLDLAK